LTKDFDDFHQPHIRSALRAPLERLDEDIKGSLLAIATEDFWLA
jgi:hypothetical protein